MVLDASNVEFAQSHMIPLMGKQWTIKNNSLNLVAGRDALAAVELGNQNVLNAFLEVEKADGSKQQFPLQSSATFPASEGGEAAYSQTARHVLVPGAWIEPGIKVRVGGSNFTTSTALPSAVVSRLDLDTFILPIHLYGATNQNTGVNLEDNRLLFLNQAKRDEFQATLPFTSVSVHNHPLGIIALDSFVRPPTGSAPAAQMQSTADMSGGSISSRFLGVVWNIKEAFGDGPLNRTTYGSFVITNGATRAWANGGVAFTGSGSAVGDATAGLLWHEGGHSIGLSHSHAEATATPATYPYPLGSLKGSAWAYDASKNQMRSPLVPPAAPRGNCPASFHTVWQVDQAGRCFRFDPMHDSGGQHAANYAYTPFSDFSMATVQKWGQQRARLVGNAIQRLDSTGNWLNFTPPVISSDKIADNYPVSFGREQDFVWISHSLAGTAEASRVAYLQRNTGNSIRQIDPTDPTDLSDINVNQANARYRDYCRKTGCDFTLRLTYSDGSTNYRILKGSARVSWQPAQWKADYQNPNSADSFLEWYLNIPTPAGSPRVTRVELLETTQAWSKSLNDIRNAPVVVLQNF